MNITGQLKHVLNSTCSVLQEAQSVSNIGEPVQTTNAIATNVPCRIEKLKPDEAGMRYPKYDVTKQYRVYFAGYPVTDANGTLITLDVQTTTYFLAFNNSLGVSVMYQLINVIDVDNLGQLLEVDCIKYPY